MACFRCLCLCVLLVVLGGCLPTAHTRMVEQMDGYVGGDFTAMSGALGTPVISSERSGNGRFYAWRDCRLVFDHRGEQYSRYCEIRAWVNDNNIVERWSWWGNECPLEGVPSGCHGLFWWQP